MKQLQVNPLWIQLQFVKFKNKVEKPQKLESVLHKGKMFFLSQNVQNSQYLYATMKTPIFFLFIELFIVSQTQKLNVRLTQRH